MRNISRIAAAAEAESGFLFKAAQVMGFIFHAIPSAQMRAFALHEHAVCDVDLRLALVSGIPPTAPRLKIKSLAKPTLHVSRPRPGPVRLSLFARPGDQAPTVQTDPAPLLGRRQAQLLSSSTGRPSPSARTPHHGRPLDDESNLGWAVTRHPSCVTRLASSHLPAWSAVHSR